MNPGTILLVIILSIGISQGLIYGIILWFKSSINKISNRFLATILFFFSYRLFVELLKLFDIGFYDLWYHVLLEYNWIYGALIYFFVKASVTPNYKFIFKKNIIHFLPVFIEFIWSNFIKSQNFYWDGSRESLSWLGYYGYVLWMHYPTMYIVGALLIIYYSIKAQRFLQTESNEDYSLLKDKISWIKRVLIILRWFSLLIIMMALIDVLFFDYAFNRRFHYPFFIGLAIITYWLGIEGFSKRNELMYKLKITLLPEEKTKLKKIAKKLTHAMTYDKLYLNSDLTLKLLADHIEEKSYLVTKCLNTIFEINFSDFVNTHRIEALKLLLNNPENQNFTLLGMAYEVGFNSKASFNRAVKKITGKSPSFLKMDS